MKLSQGRLREGIGAAGRLPDLVWEALESALAKEETDAFLVRHEPTVAEGVVGSCVTVLALTGTRLICIDVEDRADVAEDGLVTVASSTAVALRMITSVNTSHMLGAGGLRSVTLTVGWGGGGRIDLERFQCPDPSCTGDHGYCGAIAGDDLTVRFDELQDGAEQVAGALAFAAALSKATSRP
jgi:hypothetical protein